MNVSKLQEEVTLARQSLAVAAKTLVAAIDDQAATPNTINQAINGLAVAQQRWNQAIANVPLTLVTGDTIG